MSESAHDPQLNALEAALTALQPSPPTLDRDRLLFQAGKMSVKPNWGWPALALTSTLTALVLGVLLAIPSEPRVQYVYLPAPAASPVSPPAEMVQHQPSLPEEEPRPWLRWLRLGPAERDSLVEMPRAKNARRFMPMQPTTESLRHTLGLSWQEWQQTQFLGKSTNPTEEGGF